MYRNEVIETLKQLVGEWSTDKDDIRDMVIDLMDEEDVDYYAESLPDAVSVQFEDEDGEDREVAVMYELVGSTYTITRII